MRAFERLLNLWADYNALQKAGGLLGWDQQVFMPEGGAQARAEHMARLAKMAHGILVSDEMLRTLEEAEKEAEPGSDEAAACRVIRRDVDSQRKLPSDLVSRKSRLGAASYQTWRKARAESDFEAMIPHYKGLIEVNREIADALGYTAHPYDPLHDLFEEGATHATTKQLFDSLKAPLKEIIQAATAKQRVDDSFMYTSVSPETLRDFGQSISAAMGFDYERGRLDLAANAFCSTVSVGDVRMTTRPKNHLSGVVLSSMHETGHGVYEQNIPKEWDRHPLGTGVSLGVHESQSRFWENVVGRSEPFWKFAYPLLQKVVPELANIEREQFRTALNQVTPGPIRIGSDEVSYNLHIILRFELESEIVTGKLQAEDLDEAWRAKTLELLGVKIEKASDGVLQDVHWSRGMIGYFPTYAMGNLISWQIWECIVRDIPNVFESMEKGDFSPIMDWLREKVYSQGRRYRPSELVERVTGKPMESSAYLKAMRERYV